MKKILFFGLMAVIIAFLLFGLAQTCFAQNSNTFFVSSNEAKEAYNNGIFSYYESINRKDGYKIFKGEDTISFPYSTTVKMAVVGGTFWVIQKPWTKFIVSGGKVVRRYDCRNKISGFYRLFPIKEIEVSGKELNREPGEKGEKGEPGKDGRDGRDGKDGESIESSSSWPLVIVAAIVTAGAVAIAFILRSEKKDEKAPTTSNPPGIDTGGAY